VWFTVTRTTHNVLIMN